MGTTKDDQLRTRLQSYRLRDNDYWSFRGNAARDHAHAYFQYPAMMVPSMQRELLASALEVDNEIKTVFEPFVGSGTAMTEAMLMGLNLVGYDINPLAVLLCKSKLIPFFDVALKSKLEQLLSRIDRERSNRLEADFDGRDKWFRRSVAISLSRIRRGIRDEKALWARRFFWVAMAETVRLSSNSRTSTFKLHVREEEDRRDRVITPLSTFKRILLRNFEKYRQAKDLLDADGLLSKGSYVGQISVKLSDIMVPSTRENGKFDFMITSPPYGDNATTIPYGQHSYLPLHWIDFKDIDDNANEIFLRTTHEIDRRSLGGTKSNWAEATSELKSISRAFTENVRHLETQPKDRLRRVTAFCRDLNLSIDPILSRLRADAYMMWIVGNRSVGGQPLRLNRILSDFLRHRGCTKVTEIRRRIPSKRMAIRNDVASTMGRESVLVFRKS